MGVNRITGADRGTNTPYAWNWRVAGAAMRYGALVAMFIGNGAAEGDVVANGETGSGRIIGFNVSYVNEPRLTTIITADQVGVNGIGVAQAPGHVEAILAPNNTVAIGDYLIPEIGGTTGRVQVRPVGSTIQPVAMALQNIATSASEQYVQADVLIGPGQVDGGQIIIAEGRDAPADARYLGGPGSLHINPAAAAQTPVVYRAQSDGEVLSNFKAQVDVALAGAKSLTVKWKKGATAAAANAAAPSVTLTLLDPAVSTEDNTNTMTLSKGDCVVVLVNSADVGNAVHVFSQCKKS